MPRGFKDKVKIIEVRPVSASDADHILTYEESKENTLPAPGSKKTKFYSINLIGNEEKEQHTTFENIASTIKTNEENNNNVQKVIKDMKNAEQMKSKVVDEISKTNEIESCNMTETEVGLIGDHIDEKNAKKKKKKVKKKKKKKKEKDKKEKADSIEEEPKDVSADEEIQETENAAADAVSSDGKCSKWPCLFGFISTWLAKRKERRRAKKRKAIESRASTPVQPLVEYEHRKSKGGVALTIEVDNRPMRKAVLPPIKPRPGGLITGIDEKLKLAEINRSEELDKRKKSSQEHGKRIAECHERKAESEYYYKQKVDLTIQHKQSFAKRNRTRLQRDRRPSSSMLRAPSTLPPLRNARVKPSADGLLNGSSTDGNANNPSDEIFNF